MATRPQDADAIFILSPLDSYGKYVITVPDGYDLAVFILPEGSAEAVATHANGRAARLRITAPQWADLHVTRQEGDLVLSHKRRT